MKKIATVAGYSYAVTSPEDVQVTTEDGLVLYSGEAGTQGGFVAVGREVLVSADSALVTCIYKSGGGSGGGGGGSSVDMREVYEHIDNKNVHIAAEERESWNAAKSELEKLVKKSQVTVDVSTPEGVSNANYNFIHLSGTVVKEGTLYKVTHRTRNTTHNRLTTDPRWLGVFEWRDGDTYEKVGVSLNTVQQAIGEPSEWLFEGVKLSGAPIRLCLLINAEDNFDESSQFGGIVSDSDGTDYVSTDGRVTNSVPDITLSLAVVGLQEHTADEVRHITAAERDKWNGYQTTLNNKANSATLSSHTNNASVHLSAEERAGLAVLLERKDDLLALLSGDDEA